MSNLIGNGRAVMDGDERNHGDDDDDEFYDVAGGSRRSSLGFGKSTQRTLGMDPQPTDGWDEEEEEEKEEEEQAQAEDAISLAITSSTQEPVYCRVEEAVEYYGGTEDFSRPSEQENGGAMASEDLNEPDDLAIGNVEQQEERPNYLGGWGAMVNALGSLRSGIYDALDPQEEQTEDDCISNEETTKSPVEKGAGRLLDSLDRTVDYATDRLGSALLGGMRSMGLALEVSMTPSEEINDSDGGSRPRSDSVLPEANESISQRMFQAGISTLERIGRGTAGIVTSARAHFANRKERLLLSELKLSLMEHFDACRGNEALERLQIQSTEISIKLKADMRAMASSDLATAQSLFKENLSSTAGSGGSLSFVNSTIQPETFDELPWHFFHAKASLSENELAMVRRLIDTISENSFPLLAANLDQVVDEVRSSIVDADFPPDATSIMLYYGRLRMGMVLACCANLLLLMEHDRNSMESLGRLLPFWFGSLLSNQSLSKVSSLNAQRQEALLSAISADVKEASALLTDMVSTLEPCVKRILLDELCFSI